MRFFYFLLLYSTSTVEANDEFIIFKASSLRFVTIVIYTMAAIPMMNPITKITIFPHWFSISDKLEKSCNNAPMYVKRKILGRAETDPKAKCWYLRLVTPNI